MVLSFPHAIPSHRLPFQERGPRRRRGKLTVFLGAGANYAQQPTGRIYSASASFLPTGVELAEYLATEFGYQLPTHVATAIGGPEPTPSNEREKNLAKVLRKAFIGDLGKVSHPV